MNAGLHQFSHTSEWQFRILTRELPHPCGRNAQKNVLGILEVAAIETSLFRIGVDRRAFRAFVSDMVLAQNCACTEGVLPRCLALRREGSACRHCLHSSSISRLIFPATVSTLRGWRRASRRARARRLPAPLWERHRRRRLVRKVARIRNLLPRKYLHLFRARRIRPTAFESGSLLVASFVAATLLQVFAEFSDLLKRVIAVVHP